MDMPSDQSRSAYADALSSARELLQRSLFHLDGQPVGTLAAMHDRLAASNYRECFVRDFFVSALVFLTEDETDIVRNFLAAVLDLCHQEKTLAGHERRPGVMPASFHLATGEDGRERLVADFGDRAIGRVAPVDSMMWWIILLYCYVQVSGDRAFAEQAPVQEAIRETLDLCLKDSFEIFPTLLVPDGSFMIDRRLGVYGHPLEIQSLFYGMLQAARDLLVNSEHNSELTQVALKRQQALRSYVRIFYWLDLDRLNEIHRFDTEEFGSGTVNMLNVYPESIPEWVGDWLPEDTGYMVGNLGPGRMDFRVFSMGNLLAILFDLATPDQANWMMNLFEQRWHDLLGLMPMKICYPAISGDRWKLQTGCDPKNVPWSYHNGGNWPVLLWAFVAAAVKTGRSDLASRACRIVGERLGRDNWPEYYDGRSGRLVGRRANFNQVWSAAAFIYADRILSDAGAMCMFPGQPVSIRCFSEDTNQP